MRWKLIQVLNEDFIGRSNAVAKASKPQLQPTACLYNGDRSLNEQQTDLSLLLYCFASPHAIEGALLAL